MKKELTAFLSFLPLLGWPQPATSQPSPNTSRLVRQRFHHELPAGNYSGICPIGNNRYAVVDDKAAEDGFYVFRIDIDSVKGRITDIENEGYRSSGLPNRDMEGICYCPTTQTVFISGEDDNEVYEYRLDGQRTGRQLAMPPEFKKASKNYGLEALTYDAHRHLFFTTSEQPLPGDTLLRIQAFGDDLRPLEQYLYRPDEPDMGKRGRPGGGLHGVSGMCALDDGRLLVMERQIRVPKMKIGARVVTRIYEVVLPPNGEASPAIMEKRLVKEIKTRLTLTGRRFANCEGICEPYPGLLLIVADSQNRFRGVLRDWFMLLRL